MNKNVIIGIGAGCVFLCIIVTGVGLAIGGTFFTWLTEEPEQVTINVNAPTQTAKGNRIMIPITIQNTSAAPQVLDSIDIPMSYLNGIAIEGSEPEYIDSYPIPFADYHSYTFMREIAPGDTFVVRFFALAVKTGDFSGEIDICIDSGTNCASFYARTVVGN